MSRIAPPIELIKPVPRDPGRAEPAAAADGEGFRQERWWPFCVGHSRLSKLFLVCSVERLLYPEHEIFQRDTHILLVAFSPVGVFSCSLFQVRRSRLKIVTTLPSWIWSSSGDPPFEVDVDGA